MDLHQGKFWETEEGDKILITEMTPRHAYNCTRWLERYACQIADRDSWNMLSVGRGIGGEQAALDFEFELERDEAEKDADPVRWVRSTQVWQALDNRAEGREPTTAELFGWED